MKNSTIGFSFLILVFGILLYATNPTILESIYRIEEDLADDSNREPTLTAIDPLLEKREAKAKELAMLRVSEKVYPPAVVYFCADRNSLSCPGTHADDTIHLYEGDYFPQFTAPSSKARLQLSLELDSHITAYFGNTSKLHELGHEGLKPLSVNSIGEIDLGEMRNQGLQVLVVFAESFDHRRRFKFVWLVDGSDPTMPRESDGRRH